MRLHLCGDRPDSIWLCLVLLLFVLTCQEIVVTSFTCRPRPRLRHFRRTAPSPNIPPAPFFVAFRWSPASNTRRSSDQDGYRSSTTSHRPTSMKPTVQPKRHASRLPPQPSPTDCATAQRTPRERRRRCWPPPQPSRRIGRGSAPPRSE